ncbi:hypothetical protein DRQ05_02470, partial [bacterium]
MSSALVLDFVLSSLQQVNRSERPGKERASQSRSERLIHTYNDAFLSGSASNMCHPPVGMVKPAVILKASAPSILY